MATNLKDEAIRLLDAASSGLGRNRDITTVIFDIFAEELERQSTLSGSEVPLEVLVNCVQFIHALLYITTWLCMASYGAKWAFGPWPRWW